MAICSLSSIEGDAESVALCCGLQEPLKRLPNSDVWTLSKEIPDLSKAVISYGFVIDGKFSRGMDEFKVWRGVDAPPPPETLEPPGGCLFERTLKSEMLGETRELFIYLPPDYAMLEILGLPVVYLADGSSILSYADVVEPHNKGR